MQSEKLLDSSILSGCFSEPTDKQVALVGSIRLAEIDLSADSQPLRGHHVSQQAQTEAPSIAVPWRESPDLKQISARN